MINKKISTITGTIILFAIATALSVSFLLGPTKKIQIRNDNDVFLNNSAPRITEPQVDIDTGHKEIDNTTEVRTINISEPFQPTPNENGEYYGTLTLTGYLNMDHRICKENEPCNKTVDYASLIVVSTNNNLIYEYMKLNKGNAFVDENSIGIGCYEKNNKRIYSINHSNYGSFDNIIIGSDLEKILQSNINNPITIQLSKSYLTVGSGAPECYSHFRLFEILNK